MDKESLKVARKFAKGIKSRFNPEKVIFFGSRVRGDHLKTSDYDFILVSEKFRKVPFIFRASKLYDFWKEKEDIEPLCYTPEEFERKKKQIGIVRQAVKEGINI